MKKALDQVQSLSSDDLARLVVGLDRAVAARSLARLSPEERCQFIYALAHLPVDQVDALASVGEQVRNKLGALRDKGLNTFSRVAAVLLEAELERYRDRELDYTPLDGGPAVVLVANMGAQVSTPKPTLGYHLRQRRGLVPPFGLYYIASFLELLGVETRVFNLALGEEEYRELEETIDALKERLYFVSFGSNFLGEGELDAVFYLSEVLERLHGADLRPRLVGGGMGVYFSRETYLRHTPLQVVIGRYGEPCFGDMIFSDFRGPRDERDNLTLFGHIPNLYIATRHNGQIDIHATEAQPLLSSERRVLANTFNFGAVRYADKYWATGLAIAICSPDDLNIPLQLGQPDAVDDVQATDHDELAAEGPSKSNGSRRESWAEPWIAVNSTEYPLHPANYLFKPQAAKVMTTFGNCPRGCKFCQFTQFDEHLFFLSASETIQQFNRLLQTYPETHLLLIDDDDFLLRKRHCIELIAGLKENSLTRGKVFYVETVPMEIEPSILHALREVGFRAILMGVESPVEKVARQVGKLAAQHSFEKFVNAPYVAHDAGFFTRVTSIPFYPLVTERDLVEIVRQLTGYIDHGISVTVFPLVQALPGTELVTSRQHEFTVRPYDLPDHRTLDLLEYILPDEPVIRELSFASMSGTAARLEALLTRHKITGDYPMSLGVLAFFQSIVETWRQMPARTVADETLGDLEAQINQAIVKMVAKHFVQRDVQQAVYEAHAGRQVADDRLATWLDENVLAFALAGLRMFFDFGAYQEILGAARLTARLARQGVGDALLNQSLQYSLERPLTDAQRAELAAIAERLNVPQ